MRLECGTCREVFDNTKDYGNHCLTHEKPPVPPSASESAKCPKCHGLERIQMADGGPDVVCEECVSQDPKGFDARELLKKALDALIWCSGSPDFQPEGQARIGWVKGPQEVMAKIVSALKSGNSKKSIQPGPNKGGRNDPPTTPRPHRPLPMNPPPVAESKTEPTPDPDKVIGETDTVVCWKCGQYNMTNFVIEDLTPEARKQFEAGLQADLVDRQRKAFEKLYADTAAENQRLTAALEALPVAQGVDRKKLLAELDAHPNRAGQSWAIDIREGRFDASKDERDYTPEEALVEAVKRFGKNVRIEYHGFGNLDGGKLVSGSYVVKLNGKLFQGDTFKAAFEAADRAAATKAEVNHEAQR